ncbi:MAG: cell division protein ZipA C-terminal FtsZ-binding domain-containing protein [Pseudomonadota bacterium]
MEYLRWVLVLIGVAILLAVYLISQRRRDSEVADYAVDETEEDILDIDDEPSPATRRQPPVDVSESDARSHVLSNLSHELETLNHLLGVKPTPDSEAPPPPAGPAYVSEPEIAPDPSLPEGEMLGDLFAEEEQEQGPELTAQPQPDKIITLHVCARGDEQIQGDQLLAVFEQRGYDFGEMNIYHSRVDGTTVFSVVNMVEPGWFDPDAMLGFTTPGISMFLRLPGPLAGDVAYDVLVSEARELARALNAQVLDASRSTLTLQLEQHMREELKRESFEQKRAKKATPVL